jgi:hypothetical protein
MAYTVAVYETLTHTGSTFSVRGQFASLSSPQQSKQKKLGGLGGWGRGKTPTVEELVEHRPRSHRDYRALRDFDWSHYSAQLA